MFLINFSESIIRNNISLSRKSYFNLLNLNNYDRSKVKIDQGMQWIIKYFSDWFLFIKRLLLETYRESKFFYDLCIFGIFGQLSKLEHRYYILMHLEVILFMNSASTRHKSWKSHNLLIGTLWMEFSIFIILLIIENDRNVYSDDN